MHYAIKVLEKRISELEHQKDVVNALMIQETIDSEIEQYVSQINEFDLLLTDLNEAIKTLVGDVLY